MHPSKTQGDSKTAGQPRHWRTLTAAWLGWAFDGLDGYLYIMVAVPFVRELVLHERGLGEGAIEAGSALAGQIGGEVQSKAAIIQAMFLVGWAMGGAVFGRIGDRLGRARTLTLTILTYAVFTGLAFFAQAWWHLLIFRFIAALGIGGEWAAGSALVSETLPSRHRAWASALLQSGYIMGCIAASLTAGWMAHLDSPRWVFVVGVLPAVMTWWIRRSVPEPEEWKAARSDAPPAPIGMLFSRGLWKTTVLVIAMTGICLTTVWCFLFYLPQAIGKLPEVSGWSAARVAKLKTDVTVVFLLVNIAGNFVATYLGKWLGYRVAFALLSALSLGCFIGLFWEPLTLETIYWKTSLTALVALGMFGLFPLYIPPLFPTLVRTLGSGFTYNVGRLISAAGTMFAGIIAAQADGPQGAIWWVGWLYVPAILVGIMSPLAPRSRREAGWGGGG
ncbi:MAG: MFS transporter [Phycisphaerales bacterium]